MRNKGLLVGKQINFFWSEKFNFIEVHLQSEQPYCCVQRSAPFFSFEFFLASRFSLLFDLLLVDVEDLVVLDFDFLL